DLKLNAWQFLNSVGVSANPIRREFRGPPMSEVASFGNIVNSLLSLRENYHEQLKAVPQYEAYLHVQSATEKAAGALHGSADSPASIAAEVIDSLQFARSRFEQHLNSIPEY